MYKVYCDNYLLYSPELSNYVIESPKVNVELNKTGSFTFSIYPDHPNYNKLKKLKSVVTVYRNGDSEPLFRGRILDDEQGFYNEKQVTCEGELAFLIDSIQRPYDYATESTRKTVEELFTYFVEQHNLQVETAHQFNVGTITVSDPNTYVLVSDYSYMNTLDSINKKLIGTEGGYIRIRHEQDGNYIDYLSDLTTLSNQTIEFGKNLLEIKKTVKGADIGTAVIPLGAKLTTTTEEGEEEETDERLTIKDVNGGLDYLYNQDAVDQYGWIFKSVTYDDITDASVLKSKGQEYLAEVINLSVSIDLTAVDLAALNADINAFNLGTNIRIKSTPHSLDTNMLVTKLSIDLLNPQSNKLTLGTTYSTFTEQQKSLDNLTASLISSKTNINEVSTLINNTCYSKLQINNTCSNYYALNTEDGAGVLDNIKSKVRAGVDIVQINVSDATEKIYVGMLQITESSFVIHKTVGTLNCSVSNNNLVITDGRGPYKIYIYA